MSPTRWAWLALLLAPTARAQFALTVVEGTTVEGTTERAAPAIFSFGSLYAEESPAARFRLRNISSAPATVTALVVAGVGFTLVPPPLPAGLAPQAAIDFSVAFHSPDTGSYSASLRAENVSILLTATVAPRLTYRIVPAPATPFPGPVDFGGVVRGSVDQRRITIQNDTAQLLIVPAILVQGAAYGLLAPPPSGQALAPHQGGEFTVVFHPQAIGLLEGSLTIGDRAYPLLGTGAGPPLPKPTLWIELDQAASASQGKLLVRFDAPAQTAGTGTATLDFRGPADSTIAFAAGGRTVTFPIAPGDVEVVLPFQTGTTAGVLTFTAQISGAIDQHSVTIAAASPGISTVQAVRSANGLEVRIAGFDNTRTLAALTFTFYDAAGATIAPGAILADARAEFAQYFAGSDLGGVFLLSAVFPVTGDATLVASCEASLVNTVGASKTQRTTF